MTEMIEVRTGELVGAALDWAVAMALGYSDGEDAYHEPAWMDGDRYVATKHLFKPSNYWSQCGSLIERYGVSLERNAGGFCDADQPWYAEIHDDWATGADPLVAACRALVGFKFGKAVQVPASLVTA